MKKKLDYICKDIKRKLCNDYNIQWLHMKVER